MIVNVGIRKEQKEKIIELLEYGDSLNKFVQEAVDKKLSLFPSSKYLEADK